ncbi:MAG: endolytic transglycosylase MltG [Candidatus Pacebacteria bacterium]|nr:endolytic transglycosylase MltG [Candidatus Paceibacterota bacterium]
MTTDDLEDRPAGKSKTAKKSAAKKVVKNGTKRRAKPVQSESEIKEPRKSSVRHHVTEARAPYQKSSLWRWFKWSVIAAVGLLALLVVIVFAPGPLKTETKVYIKEGTSLSEMATILNNEKVLRWPFLFKAVVMAQGGGRRLRHGEYLFTARVSMEKIFWMMLRGKVVMYQLTVPEGMRTIDVVKMINDEPLLQGEISGSLVEGSLLPETYDFARGGSRSDVIGRMTAAMNSAVQDAWSSRASDLPYRNPRDLVTMASIVERETPLASERTRVAGVYLNRLRMGMRLQADPTTVYAVGLKNPDLPLRKVLTRSDLLYMSPYNTYRVYGLPPGPIANPSIESLKAAANPMTSNDLYFVATGRGGHNFATNLKDHNRNVNIWQRHLRQMRSKVKSQ